MKLKTPSPKVAQIFRAAFPFYRGRKWSISSHRGLPEGVFQLECLSYWDGGSRSDFVLLNLASLDARALPGTDPFKPRPAAIQVPAGWVIVESRIFMSKPSGLTIHCGEGDFEALKAGCEAA